MASEDGDLIDEALEEAFTKEEVNEVHQEPEPEQPKVIFMVKLGVCNCPMQGF